MLRSKGLGGIGRTLVKLFRGTERAKQSLPNAVEQMARTNGVTHRSLKAWSRQHRTPYHVVRSINAPTAIRAMRDCGAQALIYGGGGILRAPIIDSVHGNVINSHAGPLPEVRGMNAIEWATLLGERQHITIHFIDHGIDTGDIIACSPVSVASGETVESLRAKAVATGLHALIRLLEGVEQPAELPRACNAGPLAGRQCYAMSPALLELVTQRLAQGECAQPRGRK